MKKEILQRKIVAGAILKNNKVLIIQRSPDEGLYPNMWELPSGKREELENTNQALLREVKEETGLDVKILKILSVFDYQIETENEIRDATQISYLVEIIGENDVKLSPEHQNFAWIGIDDIENYDITKETKSVIAKALKVPNNNWN